MKKILLMITALLLFSCALPAPKEPAPGEVLIAGLWGGWIITAGGETYATPIGIKTINCPVEIVQHEGCWYIWNNGYGMEITPQ